MNAQLSIAGCLRVSMQAHPVFGWFRLGPVCVLAVLMLVSAVCSVPANAEDYDIIIEKNLFHDQRQKWEMEKSQTKGTSSQAGPRDLQSIDKIKLFGTVIKDSHAYAVMRVSSPSLQRRATRRGGRGKDQEKASAQVSKQQDNKRPYSVGDFISGYQIVDIQSESVLLQDPYDNKRYEIYMNDAQAERITVRTEITEDKPELSSRQKSREQNSKRRSQVKSAPPANKAASADVIRKRFERDIQLMREEKNDAMTRQAQRDWDKLQPLMPSLDEQGQEELMRLKSEFEKQRQ